MSIIEKMLVLYVLTFPVFPQVMLNRTIILKMSMLLLVDRHVKDSLWQEKELLRMNVTNCINRL